MRCEKCNKQSIVFWIEEESLTCGSCRCGDIVSTMMTVTEFYTKPGSNQRINIENLIFILKEN